MSKTLNEMSQNVLVWMLRTFGAPDKTVWDQRERALRFIEEALELVQALGLTPDEVKRVSDYVYARAKGEPSQEVSGVLITLLGLCTAAGIDPDQAFNDELVRIQDPAVMQRVRERQAEKRALTDQPANDPLAGYYANEDVKSYSFDEGVILVRAANKTFRVVGDVSELSEEINRLKSAGYVVCTSNL